MNRTTECTISIDDDHDNFPVDVTYDAYYDGIGSYEFWGFKGYDKGNFCMDIEDIKPIFKDETPEEREMITKYINDNYDKLVETIDQQIYDQWENQKEEYDESRAEARYYREKYGDY